MTKDQAREESLRLWHALPPEERQSINQAELFADTLAERLAFRTMGNSRKVIFGWLVRDLEGLPAWGNVPPEPLLYPERIVLIPPEPPDDPDGEAPDETPRAA